MNGMKVVIEYPDEASARMAWDLIRMGAKSHMREFQEGLDKIGKLHVEAIAATMPKPDAKAEKPVTPEA